MAEPIHDGGPAYPSPSVSQNVATGETTAHQSEAGATLRDYFAARAMAGSLAGEPGSHLAPKNLARESYQYADAMLEARKRHVE